MLAPTSSGDGGMWRRVGSPPAGGRPAVPPPEAHSVVDRLVDELVAVADLALGDAGQRVVSERLVAAGLTRLLAHPGSYFDPTVQRVVGLIPAADVRQVNTIAETVRPGWAWNGRIVRYVEVRVHVAPDSPALGVRRRDG